MVSVPIEIPVQAQTRHGHIYDCFQKILYPVVAENIPFTFLFTYPSRTAGFQQGCKRSGFQALGNGTNGVGNMMWFLLPWQPCESRSILHILLEAASLFSMPEFLPLSQRNADSERLVGQGSKLPIRLHVTPLYPSLNYYRQS